MRKIFLILLAQGFALLLFAQTSYDGSVINKINAEEQKNSQVMDIAFQLTDVAGPRLTASPGFLTAATWAKKYTGRMGFKECQSRTLG